MSELAELAAKSGSRVAPVHDDPRKICGGDAEQQVEIGRNDAAQGRIHARNECNLALVVLPHLTRCKLID